MNELLSTTPERQEEPRRGRFFRNVRVPDLHRLEEGQSIGYDGKREFKTVAGGTFNPKKLPAEIPLTAYALRALSEETHDNDLRDKAHNAFSDLPTCRSILAETARMLTEKSPKYDGLDQAVSEAMNKKSVTPLTEYLRAVGGDTLMVRLKTQGYSPYPSGSFSDLIPLSVGAPLARAVSPKMVTLEFDFPNKDVIIVDPNDPNNEHEVMVQEIRPDNLRTVYPATDKGWEDLCARLRSQFPDHFNGTSVEQLLEFAQNIPLENLLKDLNIQK